MDKQSIIYLVIVALIGLAGYTFKLYKTYKALGVTAVQKDVQASVRLTLYQLFISAEKENELRRKAGLPVKTGLEKFEFVINQINKLVPLEDINTVLDIVGMNTLEYYVESVYKSMRRRLGDYLDNAIFDNSYKEQTVITDAEKESLLNNEPPIIE